MGWEQRHGGRLYLYRNRRVNGLPRKEYLGAKGRFGFGSILGGELARQQEVAAQARELTRQVRSKFRERINGILATLHDTVTELRNVTEGVLYAIGFHKHNRGGDWRMRREMKALGVQIEQLRASLAKTSPTVNYAAPETDTEAVEVYAKARAGDKSALEQVRALIVSRNWVNWVGDLGSQATHQLIHNAAAGDPVWKAGIAEKANALHRELLGQNPSVLEQLLVRRVVNGWIATHALELELTVRPPADPGSREYLDKALTRAQKRYTEAIRELARIRRLALPVILASVGIPVNSPGVLPTPALLPPKG